MNEVIDVATITKFTNEQSSAVIELFNRHCGTELVYEQWTEESFKRLFTNNVHFRPELAFVAKDGEKIIGFAQGLYMEKTRVGYVTMVIVDKDHRRDGVGTALLEALEAGLKEFDPIRIDCSFFNPINLVWNVPNTNKHQHPNAPGVEYPSAAFNFFEHHGYKGVTQENSYYLDLAEFTLPESVKERIETLKEQGITFEYFDKNKHEFKDLFDKLGSELWRTEITDAVMRDEPLKVLVPLKDGQALGFTGPIYPQPNGRGYFAGIGIHPEAQGGGVGKSLFFLLCQHEKEQGAKYMTLFTGETNPARRMYEAAGFKIVKSWKIMRKQLA